ncbi:MAG: hypothetical protein L0206_09225, partial [Actinobacteria bacterium]|nr:hypothetical protein [Actinomycetota bacterium]
EGLVPDGVFSTIYVYDQLDRLIRATDNVGQTSRFSYDSRDNLVFRSDPVGPLTNDPLGLFPGQINGPGNTKTYFFDGLDRLVLTACDLREGGEGGAPLDLTNPRNPDGQVRLGYAYDSNSRLVGIIDDNGNRTSFGYDALDRQVSKTYADLAGHVFAYDRDDNLVSATDPNGTQVTRTYDALHRLVRAEVARAPGVAGTTLETYAYDGLSRLTLATDDNGATAATEITDRVYDSLSRLLEERLSGAVVSSTYSGDGKRLSLTYPGGRRIDHAHDAIDRLKAIAEGGLVLATWDWVGPGARPLRRTHGNGTTLTLGYDAVQRVTQLAHAPATGAPLVDREYGYDRADNRTFERRLDAQGLTDRFVYDSVYRLVETRYDEDGGPSAPRRDTAALAYLLDGVGNRREVDRLDVSAETSTDVYAVNTLNEYTSIAAAARAHDINGNLLDDGSRLFVYDHRDRLVAVNDRATSGPIATYRYDAQNRRTQKTVFDPATGLPLETTRFAYDGWRSIEETDATGSTEATHVYGVALDEHVQIANAAGTFYLHQNARLDVVALTDASGAVAERTLYDDFGAPDHASALGNPYLFQGARFDAETGLYYFRNRYYDPETGRFLQRDPVWDPGNAGNQYTFGGNGPISRSDALGLEWYHSVPGVREAELAYTAGKTVLVFAGDATGYVAALAIDGPQVAIHYEFDTPFLEDTRQAAKLLGAQGQDDVAGTLNAMGAGVAGTSSFGGGLQDLVHGADIRRFARTGAWCALTPEQKAHRIGDMAIEMGAAVVGTRGQATTAGRGVWDLPPGRRGAVIEQRLGQNLPQNYPVIDKLEGGVATSMKSMDLANRTYLDPRNIVRVGEGYVDKLAQFQGRRTPWAGVSVRAADIQHRTLQVAVPPGATPPQKAALQTVVDYGKQQGVTVQLVEMK